MMESKTEEDSSSPPVKRFQVNKFSAVGVWVWDMKSVRCAICCNLVKDLCIECQVDQLSPSTKEECPVARGVCDHAYHSHCISRWLKTRSVCPLDNMKWELKE